MIVLGNFAAIRGTSNLGNWLRDFRFEPELCRTHVDIGTCPAGPLDAAMALAEMLPPEVDTITGHSLGGQIAVQLAGIVHAVRKNIKLLVTWDAPKAGGPALTRILADVTVRQYKFRGSVVTDWPLFLDQHVRDPLIEMEPWTMDPVEAHSILRACDWWKQHDEKD
jgi:hypothetical protein